MRGLFVTGTDTGVGKSVVAAAICAALAARGKRVAAFKPVVTGLDEPPEGGWPADHELLAAAAGGAQAPREVTPYTFRDPVSPHYASEREGKAIDPTRIVASANEAAGRADFLVCEGVGGLLVPITPGYSVRDLAIELALPLVVVARSGLGTINHTLLTTEAARSAGLRVAGVVMSPWPDNPEPIQISNRETVQALADVPVNGLPQTRPAEVASAGEALPLDDWF